MLVSEIIDDAKEITGLIDDAVIFSRLTDAIELLANKGKWDPLVGYVDICALSDGKTVTLPRDIDTPLAVNVGGRPMYFRNRWYEFHLNGAGSGSQTPWTWDDVGDSPCFMDIITASNLIAVADLKTDLGALLRVFGYDSTGKYIRSQNADGTWVDGFLVPINLYSDFPNNIIVPDTQRIFLRNFATGKITELLSVADHQLVSGQFMTLSLLAPPLPAPLVNGTGYYVRVNGDKSISLFPSQSGALSGAGEIVITSASNASQVTLVDSRGVRVTTQFTSVAAHTFKTGMLVNFTATAIPTPLVIGTDYYARIIDATNFTAHASLDDANTNTNPIDVTDVGNTVVAHARQDFNPVTLMSFSVNHNFLQGDVVKAQNSTGTFPSPLLSGVGYYVKYVSSTSLTLHASLADASSGANPIVITTPGSGVTTLIKIIPAAAATGSSNQITAAGHNLTIQANSAAMTTASRLRATNVAKITMGAAHGLITGNYVSIAAMGDASYDTTKAQVTVLSPRIFTYTSIGGNEASTADVTGQVTLIPSAGDFVQFSTNGQFPNPLAQNTTYLAESPMSADTFTVYTASADSINITTNGTGQLYLIISRVIQLAFNSQWATDAARSTTGDIIKVSSTGALPATLPVLSTVTSYYLRKLTDGLVKIFDTLARANDSTVRISATRARAANVATIVTSAAHTLATNDYVDIAGIGSVLNGVLSDFTVTGGGTAYVQGETASIVDGTGHTASGTLNVTAGAITSINITNGGNGFTVAGALTITGATSGSVDAVVSVGAITNSVSVPNATYNGNRKQITVTGATTFTYACTGLNEPTTADVNGTISVSPITVTGLGAGTVSMVIDRAITPTVFSSLLPLSSSAFLKDLATVQFQTTGTLPAPLVIGVDYKLSISNGLLQVVDALNNNVTITGIGVGTHTMVMTRNFGVTLPTYLTVTANNYNNGDAVTLVTTGTLPTGLSLLTTYYLRRISDDTVEIYDTSAHAINTAATTGRIVPTDTGSGTHSFQQILDNIVVQKVVRVQKSESSGFIKLYAWDTGRADNLTLIGNYYPDETQPNYRRIKIANGCCRWVRMRYKKKNYKIISTDDFIPLKSKMAIIMMLKAIEVYRSEFVSGGKELEDLALKFLKEKEESGEGPDSTFVQFNAAIFTNPDAESMDNGEF